MAGKPGFRVVSEFKRADQALLEAFAGASSAQIADSMARMGAMDGGRGRVRRSRAAAAARRRRRARRPRPLALSGPERSPAARITG